MINDAFIRPRIVPPENEEISIYLEIFDFKNNKTLLKMPVIDYHQKDSNKYLR